MIATATIARGHGACGIVASMRDLRLHATPTLVAAFVAISCGHADRPAVSTAAQVPTSAPHSIDLAAMDRSVKPGADFFLYANGAWLAKAEIPKDRSDTGLFQRLSEEVERRTADLLEQAGREAPAGSELRKVGDYYASYMDEAAIEAGGLAPISPALDVIAKIGDAKALAAFLGSQLRADVDPLNATHFHTDRVLGLWVEQDLNDPSRAAPYLLQGGLGMPDRSYYLDESPSMAAHRAKYVKHVARMLQLAKVANAEAKAARIVALERRIAETHTSREDSEDVAKGNNPWPRAEFASRAPGLDWEAFFAAAGLGSQPSFIVWHPGAVKGLAILARSEPLDVWKDYLTARALDHAARFLPKAFEQERFAFYETELHGVPTPRDRWKRAVEVTNAAMNEAVGKAYVARYFPPESKREVERMVAGIVAAFGRRIDALTWMSPATKAKAKEKVAALRVGIGYPDTWRDFSELSVVRGDALGNQERAEFFEYRRNVAKLGRPMDRGEWAMWPQDVDAVNLPVRNAINFPAAILVPPYFDPRATEAANFGGIGSVIGHEISHSFDDQGAKFDAHGRLASWWTPDDLAHFEAVGAALAAQFDAYHPLPDVAINGKLTLSENIADLAGLAAAYDAWKASLGGTPAPEDGGLTGDQQFFVSFGQIWQEKMRDETLRELLATNGHAPAHYRTFTVRNLDAWYSAFDVKPGDPLYLPPSGRLRVW